MDKFKRYRVSLGLILIGLALTAFIGIILAVSPATLIGPQ